MEFIMTENIFEGLGVEVRLKGEEDFLKVKETLTRIGVSSKSEKKTISILPHTAQKR
jgi:hypothetical protein